jgi:hypothetical protein
VGKYYNFCEEYQSLESLEESRRLAHIKSPDFQERLETGQSQDGEDKSMPLKDDSPFLARGGEKKEKYDDSSMQRALSLKKHNEIRRTKGLIPRGALWN